MRKAFETQIIESGYIHKQLKPDMSNTLEARLFSKKVLESRELWDGVTIDSWAAEGNGGVSAANGALRMVAPSRTEYDEPMAHYTGYAYQIAALKFDNEDWTAYNRITCMVKPICNGFHKPYLVMHFYNDGKIKIPDIYNREGFHNINLVNNVWNKCVWEFPEMPRDCVTQIAFEASCNGKELFGGDTFVFDIKDVKLEKIENPDVSLGWSGNDDTFCFPTAGYWADGQKQAVITKTEGEFKIIDAENGSVVYIGTIEKLINEKGVFGILDFSSLKKEGRYTIYCQDITSKEFGIRANILDEAVWKAINFLYSERCGYPVSGSHSSCHGDIYADHNALRIIYNGGWHDAGDLSQQTLQTAEVVEALFEMAVKTKDDSLLYTRLVEEARWGLDFVLKMRFGDGYRATSAGLCRWTNGMIGDTDDEAVRVHNRSFENFLMGGVEAYAGACLKSEDEELSWVAINAAKEDYIFALERFNEVGIEHQFEMEHTYNAGPSQYYAAASWCASQIFNADGDIYYAQEAERFGDLLLDCRDDGEAGLHVKGFFYRDEDKKTIVHFNHQSREHIFVQALESLCTTQRNNPKRMVWETALVTYGEYIKYLYSFSRPYGMLPAGIYAMEEADDKDTFHYQHRYTTYEAEKENYREQLLQGVNIGGGHYLKHFPVWFSFRGNTAVLLSTGKAASIISRYFQDDELKKIARDQLYWVAGKNPFGQSLMYGEGSNYAQQYCALAGEMVGEIPVGVQTRGNEDVPYWPMANNATYKEVWTTSVGHWIRLAADLI